MPFMGWSAKRRKEGWFAVKNVADDGYSSVRITHVCHRLNISPDAPIEIAEREIRRLYTHKVLK